MVLTAYRQLEADTLDTTRRLEAELAKLQPVLEREGVTYHDRLFRQADFIEHAVGNVADSLVIGGVLVAVVLFLFLFNVRTAVISLTAIPLSLLAAVGILGIFNVGLNTLTLGGLAIAIGEVVDDGIIDVENIFRRLRDNSRSSTPRPVFDVVLAASLEVRGAVVYATFVVVLAFVPVFFLSGLQGRLFAPLGLAYMLAVLASLVVALLVTPALSLVLLQRAGTQHEPPLLTMLKARYDRLVTRRRSALDYRGPRHGPRASCVGPRPVAIWWDVFAGIEGNPFCHTRPRFAGDIAGGISGHGPSADPEAAPQPVCPARDAARRPRRARRRHLGCRVQRNRGPAVAGGLRAHQLHAAMAQGDRCHDSRRINGSPHFLV